MVQASDVPIPNLQHALLSVPGCLTMSRVVLAAAFPFVVNSPAWALAIVAAAGISDFLDGWYARRFHISTPIGAVLDPITDKIFATSVMVSLVAAGKLNVAWAVAMSVRELGELPLVFWLAFDPRVRRLRAKHFGSNMLGKLTTGLQFGALIAVLLDQPGRYAWLIATAVVGAIAATSYWIKFRAALRSDSAA